MAKVMVSLRDDLLERIDMQARARRESRSGFLRELARPLSSGSTPRRCIIVEMEDAVTRFCRGSERNAPELFMSALTPDVELVSPISGHMVFRGSDDVRVLLCAVYGTLVDLTWSEQDHDGPLRLAIGECKVGPVRLSDAMVFDLAEDGRIRRIRPHLRPWLALTLFALLLGPKVARHPGVVWRALRG
jgi:metal-responsive CopG/Arc/MetJ family transcriptional regulator